MSATDTLRTTDRQLIAVQALFAARRYHPRVRPSKTEQIASRRRVLRANQAP
jgi:hypothetical protein